jgi:FkbM family methyltransferase
LRFSVPSVARAAVQSSLAFAGVRLERIPECVEPILPFDVLRLAIIAELQRAGIENFYFVQIGANDGVLYDNLNPLIREFDLRGCLVEPLPDVFARLQSNYRDQPQLTFRNCMIADPASDGLIHRFRPDAPVPQDFFHGLARQDQDYIRRRAKNVGLSAHVEAVRCEVQDFSGLLKSLDRTSISLLYVDTEGADDKIVGEALRSGLRPPLIQYEWSEMSLTRRCELKLLLSSHGYRFIDIGADTVCLRGDE